MICGIMVMWLFYKGRETVLFLCGKGCAILAKEWAKAFYSSERWQQCRQSFIASRISVDGGMCQICGERLGYIVHHTVTLTQQNINDPKITLNHDLLKFECKQCHDKEEGHFYFSRKGGQRKKRYLFSADGAVIPPSPDIGSG